MPILVEDPIVPAGSLRRVRLGDLPEFNAGDPNFILTGFSGWYEPAVPDVVLVASGGAGAVAAGAWQPVERYYTLTGSIRCGSYSDLALMHRMLLAALPASNEAAVQVLDQRAGLDLQVFVRRYDKPDIEPAGYVLPFSMPVVSPDPFKYALEPQAGDVGVFSGQTWYRTYTDPGGGDPDYRTYDVSGATGKRFYNQTDPSGPYPQSISLASAGDASSTRVTVEVTGPLDAGDWWLTNQTTGARLWAQVAVAETQQLVFDMAAKTAFLNGADVGHLVYGDWLTFEPGTNTFRLVTGADSDAYAHLEALEAYQ